MARALKVPGNRLRLRTSSLAALTVLVSLRMKRDTRLTGTAELRMSAWTG